MAAVLVMAALVVMAAAWDRPDSPDSGNGEAGSASETDAAGAAGQRAGRVEGEDAPAMAHDFRPYVVRAFRLINAFALVPGSDRVVFTLLQQEYRAHVGLPVNDSGPEVGLFAARIGPDGWTPPQPLSISGVHHDYEPTISPEGRWMVFNSRRTRRRGRDPRPERPVDVATDRARMGHASATGRDREHRERRSYASLGADGLMVFHRRDETEDPPQSDL